jgi:hypothetical protein
MGMNKPHDPAGNLYNHAMKWMRASNHHPDCAFTRSDAELYLDQYFKVLEKKVATVFREHNIQNTPADKLKSPGV